MPKNFFRINIRTFEEQAEKDQSDISHKSDRIRLGRWDQSGINPRSASELTAAWG